MSAFIFCWTRLNIVRRILRRQPKQCRYKPTTSSQPKALDNVLVGGQVFDLFGTGGRSRELTRGDDAVRPGRNPSSDVIR